MASASHAVAFTATVQRLSASAQPPVYAKDPALPHHLTARLADPFKEERMSTAPSNTPKAPAPPPPHTQYVDGTLVCAWDNGVSVEVALGQRTKRGKSPVRVLCNGQQVGSGTVDLADLSDRQRLNAECAHLDGQVGDWLAYLMHTSDAITVHTQTDTGKQLQAVWQRAISAVEFVQQDEDEHQSLTADLVYPGAISI